MPAPSASVGRTRTWHRRSDSFSKSNHKLPASILHSCVLFLFLLFSSLSRIRHGGLKSQGPVIGLKAGVRDKMESSLEKSSVDYSAVAVASWTR
ncbi:hypothetical protein M431DRAFT_199040 [Trichoderma harzianum CBS 226.95]|uniref:Uncharacterized protein n=1 Tax=Trichoderma harzianum CBS 226.95 TaxID=983964 RepID=A0A2T4AUY1_TRIHA|nr:hypothetical protein M431DRAFT_199040 [Trichoderma harzianum CBS 226.95]PTB60877.1 hypothetical protein M431DRAFT_199040 [Trichoderma harzianum CBS 226.95]